MAAYLVLSPKGKDTHDPENRFIRDGFSWLAALLPVVNALVKGAYLDALVLLALRLGGWTLYSEPGSLSTVGLAILVATSLIYGFEARNREANRLMRQGWVLQAAIVAHDIGDAEEIYYGDRSDASSPDPVFKFDPDFSGKAATTARSAPMLGLIGFERGRR